MEPNQPSDLNLLSAWTRDKDRSAAGELIRRHIDFVHAVARRRVGGDEHLADDVTQAVFILLLRKAHKIHSEAAMASWLYTTTGYAANNAMKMMRRRKHHEERAAQLPREIETDPRTMAESADLQPLLHEAIDQLPRTDRQCVIMSFLQEKTHHQVAAAVGLSQDAARKRISRAVDRMRDYLASRGVSTDAATVGESLAAKHAKVSAAFIESTLNIAILSHSAEAAGAAASIAKGVSHMLFTTQVKVAAILAVALTCTGLVTAQAVRILDQSVGLATTGQVSPATQPAAGPLPNPAADQSTADLGDNVLVEFVGVSSYNGNDWHDINGQPIDSPNVPKYSGTIVPAPKYQALIRITCPDDDDTQVDLPNGQMRGESGQNKEQIVVFDARPDATSVDIRVLVSDSPWKSVMSLVANPDGVASMSGGPAEISLSPMIDQNGKSLLFASVAGVSYPMRLVCIGNDGSQHIGESQGSSATNKTNLGGYLFDIPRDKIKTIQIQTRKYNKRVTARNICLDPNNPTQARIEVGN